MKTSKTNTDTFSDEERAAMKERARELRGGKTDGEGAVRAKIEEMPDGDRRMAEKIHGIVMSGVPELKPRTWYGMPAYANVEGKVVCFFQSASKFKARYATLGFNDAANLDEGQMWPTAFALKDWGEDEERKVTELIKKAVS